VCVISTNKPTAMMKIEFMVSLFVVPCSVVIRYHRWRWLKMEAARSFETSVSNDHTIRRNNSENHELW